MVWSHRVADTEESIVSNYDKQVIVTYRIRPVSRARMRLLAAFLGVTQAELVEAWAVEQLAKLGLPDPGQHEGEGFVT